LTLPNFPRKLIRHADFLERNPSQRHQILRRMERREKRERRETDILERILSSLRHQTPRRGQLAAREPHLPPRGLGTLADLYDPLSMPPALAKAHADLDRAVEKLLPPRIIRLRPPARGIPFRPLRKTHRTPAAGDPKNKKSAVTDRRYNYAPTQTAHAGFIRSNSAFGLNSYAPQENGALWSARRCDSF